MPIRKPDLGPCACTFQAGTALYLRGDGSQSSPVEISVENAAIQYGYSGGIIDYTQFPAMSVVVITFDTPPSTGLSRFVFPSGSGYDLTIIFRNPSPDYSYSFRACPSRVWNLPPGRMIVLKISDYMGSPVSFAFGSSIPIE